MRLIIFDSGAGGKIIARRLKRLRPRDDIITISDRPNLPYGNKPANVIIRLTEAALLPYLGQHGSIVVLACNTATAAAIGYLRQTYPREVFVGFEPMIKPAAAASLSRVIAVLATPATLSSQRYQRLKRSYAGDCRVLEPDCSDWAQQIENGSFDQNRARHLAEQLIIQGADQLVLACTHFIGLQAILRRQAGPRAQILEPTKAINIRLDVLARQLAAASRLP